MKYTLLEKAEQDKADPTRYRDIRKSDGRVIRVDVQLAREAMRHAMIIRSKKRAEERLLSTYDDKL